VDARLDGEARRRHPLAEARVFAISLSRSSVVSDSRSSTASARPAIAGGSVFENRYGRERCGAVDDLACGRS
jgi:hypothetical protein